MPITKTQLFLLIAVMLCGWKSAEAAEIHFGMKSFIENFSQCVTRLTISGSAFKGLLTVKNACLLAGGFSTPKLAFGSLEKTGLLRMIDNPLGFQADSEVFREQTGFVLMPVYYRRNDWTLFLSPVTGSLNLFLSWKEQEYGSTGVTFSTNVGKEGFWETLFCGRTIARTHSEDEWFFETDLYPGGSVLHCASRLTFRRGTFFSSFINAFSFGNLVLPGSFFCVEADWTEKFFTVAVHTGMTSKNYRSSQGKTKDEFLGAGGVLSLSPFPWLNLRGLYEKTFPHDLPLLSFLSAGKTKAFAEGNIIIRLGKLSKLSVGLSRSQKHDVSRASRETWTISGLRLIIELWNCLKFDVTYELFEERINEQQTNSHVMTIKNEFESGPICFSAETEITLKNTSWFLEFGFAVEIKRKGCLFFFKLVSDKALTAGTDFGYIFSSDFFEYFRITIGFDCSF